MRRFLVATLLLFLAAALLASGCTREDKTAIIKASVDYRTYFGRPPVPGRGSCYARVGYLPTAADPSRLAPVPLFLFTGTDQERLLLQRLLDFQDYFPGASRLYDPLPRGQVLSVERRQETTVVALTLTGAPDPPAMQRLAAAASRTLGQFAGVKRIKLNVSGQAPAQMPEGGFSPGDFPVTVGPPQLLQINGGWQEPETLHEILVQFDRPVSFEKVELLDASGRKVQGEYYHSQFRMALVVHPRDPGAFSEGTPLQVRWSVTDLLGRQGAGEGTFVLLRPAHQH